MRGAQGKSGGHCKNTLHFQNRSGAYGVETLGEMFRKSDQHAVTVVQLTENKCSDQ